ncbi:MAG: hypothetical protein HC852_01660 [Acaryochloridaceae cyanobacterium RU_4_10]|nr:hypothetical protein [Acaryochloridaceae cyanobacterium RU_4_10]
MKQVLSRLLDMNFLSDFINQLLCRYPTAGMYLCLGCLFAALNYTCADESQKASFDIRRDAIPIVLILPLGLAFDVSRNNAKDN